jgi:hypothetical protein
VENLAKIWPRLASKIEQRNRTSAFSSADLFSFFDPSSSGANLVRHFGILGSRDLHFPHERVSSIEY